MKLTRPVDIAIAWLRWWLTGDCGYLGCGYEPPYGFVPECGCPIHDVPQGKERWDRKQ